MSDETKNDLPVEAAKKTKSVLNAASDLLQDQSIPDPVKRGIWAVLKRFGAAALEVPVEWLERGISERRAESEERIKFARSVNEQLIQQIKTDPEFTERASNMFAHRILRERFNLEKVFSFVIDIFKKKEYDSSADQQASNQAEETINPDWFNIFEKEASQKSSEDMQRRFAKVLVGEIEKPGSHSIKAVKELGDMDQTIANLFQKLCSVCIVLEVPFEKHILDIRVPAIGGKPDQNSLSKYGLSFDNLNKLHEYGLIISDYNSSFPYQMPMMDKNNQVTVPFRHQGKHWTLKPLPERPESNEFKINGVKLSNVGQELFHIVDQMPMPQFTQDLKGFFEQQNLQMGEVVIQKANTGWIVIRR